MKQPHVPMRVDMKIPTLIFFTIYKYIHCLSNDKIFPFFMQLWTVNEVETFQKFCRALLFGGVGERERDIYKERKTVPG